MSVRVDSAAAYERPSLRTRILRAGGWSLAGFALSQGIRFGSNLVMTRLLLPEMYGVMSIALMVMMGLALFSDIGLRQSVIQSPQGSEARFLNTVWVSRIAIGCVMSLAAVAVAAGVAIANAHGLFPRDSTYSEPVLPYVLAVIGLTGVIGGFESTKAIEASRLLSLGRLTRIQLAAQVVGIVAMLGAAYFTRTVWVLVAGFLASGAATTVLTHTHLPGVRNRFEWDRAAFREMLRFGKWILASSVLGFFSLAADKTLLGAFVSAATLGVYTIAGLLYYAVEQIFTKVASELTFPALSEVARERKSELRKTLYKFHLPVSVVAYGAVGFLGVAAPAIVRLLYDYRYQDAGWMLQILAVGLIAMPARLHAACLLSLGLSRLQFAQSMASVVLLLVALPVGFFNFGVAGAIWGIAAANLGVTLLVLYYSAVQRTLNLRRELMVLPSFLPGAAAGYVFARIIGI